MHLETFFVFYPKAIHLADVACCDKGMDVILVDEGHQPGKLIFREQALKFNAALVGITANHFVQRTTTHQFVNDIAADTVIIFGNNADSLLVVETRREIIDHQTVNPGADETDNHHIERVDGKGRAANDGACHRHRSPDVKMQILIDNFGQNIKTASGSIDFEQNRLGCTQNQHETDQIEPNIAHNGGYGTVGTDKSLVGEIGFQNSHHRAENQGGIDRFTKVQFRYGNALATSKTGAGVKSEGQLVIAGTKGYILAQSPWWLIRSFDVRYEDASRVDHFEAPFVGTSGFRYEIAEFMDKINGTGGNDYKLTAEESIAMARVVEKFMEIRRKQQGF